MVIIIVITDFIFLKMTKNNLNHNVEKWQM